MKRFVELFFQNLPLPLYIISITLHCLGIYLLSNLPQGKRNQDIIIMNLSIAEIFMSSCDLTQNILIRFQKIYDTITNYFIIGHCCFFVIPSFLFMIVLTIDRFCEIHYHIKYPLYIQKKMVMFILSICWLIGALTAITMLLLRTYYHDDMATIIFEYFFPIIEGIFIIIATITYCYIYSKFKEAAPVFPKGTTITQNTNANERTVRKTNFFVPTLIIITFIIFVIAPDIANLILFYITKTGTNLHSNILLLFYVLGYICDATIYIFLQKNIRKLLFKKLGFRNRNRNNNVELKTRRVIHEHGNNAYIKDETEFNRT